MLEFTGGPESYRPASVVLTLSCPDRPGLVHAVTGWIIQIGGNIVDSQQFSDIAEQRFFMRLQIELSDTTAMIDELRAAFADVAERYSMTYRLVDARRRLRTLVLVSKEGHCLNDLLYRQSTGSLNIVVPAVVSNHRDLERIAASFGVGFHHIDVSPGTKPESERRILALVDELDIDVVVLARYMQVLSDGMCQQLAGRAINIHHSFLPSFKGARPYHQAHARGVKLIGATVHYVTADLDEGPIIEQGVTRVDHRMDAAALARAGRDVESRTLSGAVRMHAESRVLLHGHRTIVFS